MNELPLPGFFRAEHAGDYDYRPDLGRLLEEAHAWGTTHRIPPSAEDHRQVHLLLIDCQRDFCFPEGTLYVAGRSGRGAIDDNRRTAEFIYRNLYQLTHITATFDTHVAFQIFFASFWEDANGNPLSAHREIDIRDLDRGAIRPNPAMARWLANGDAEWLRRQVRAYCEELERRGKYRLYLWPPHCILGSDGHALAGVIQEARMFHSYVRSVPSWGELKGQAPLTESYSALGPEVLRSHDGVELAERNTKLLRTLLSADAVVVAGQAASHCVRNTVEDLLAESQTLGPQTARKIYLLVDCMSAVAVPDGQGGFLADFTAQAEAALGRFKDAGMHCVLSTAPMSSWP